jgi:DNA-binding SARP family transcriptional activator/tetratricopeptide (TPR) repeat protein
MRGMTAVEPPFTSQSSARRARPDRTPALSSAAHDANSTQSRALARSSLLSALGPERGDPAPHFPIVQARLRPHAPDLTIDRPRLLEWLDEQIHRRLVCVVAEAGYGKSTLLADFSRRTRLRTIWYRPEDDDRDAVTVVRYLVAAGCSVEPNFAPRTRALLNGDGGEIPTDEAAISLFISEVDGLATQPTVIIVDDFHVIDDLPEIRALFLRIIERAPEGLSLLIASRRDARLASSRLRSLGEHVELTRRELRFDRGEMEQLFRVGYGLPLDRDLLDDLEQRTEGWAASLALVGTSLRGRNEFEVRNFVRRLSGAHGAIFDFLAEEIIGDLDDGMQSFLMRTAILQVVDPDLAAAATGLNSQAVAESISRATQLGLLAPIGEGPAGRSCVFHPLVRDFLEARLHRDIGDDGLSSLHRSVAETARTLDWRQGAHHFEQARDIASMREVLRDATAHIMGHGEFALADRYLSRGDWEFEPRFDIIASHSQVQRGQIARARAFAEHALDSLGSSPQGNDADLATANLMSIELLLLNVDRAHELALQLTSRVTDAETRERAHACAVLIEASQDGSVTELQAVMASLAERQAARGHAHYFAVSMLNLAYADRAIGNAEDVVLHASEALCAFSGSSNGGEAAFARLVRAWGYLHSNRMEEGLRDLEDALGNHREFDRPEVLAEAASVYGAYVDAALAERLFAEAERSDPESRTRPSIRVARAENCLRLRDFETARDCLAAVGSVKTNEPGFQAHHRAVQAHLAVLDSSPDSMDLIRSADDFARHGGAAYWRAYLHAVQATADEATQLAGWITSMRQEDRAILSVVAERVVPRLHELSAEARLVVQTQALVAPNRWRDALRNEIGPECPPERLLAPASLLDVIGETRDVILLRGVARRLPREQRDPNLGRRLARGLALPAHVHDLGHVTVEVGGTSVPASSIRRKALALLCYLLTRPAWTATKEQVIDALWPDANPDAVVNSLNQTLYHLRRVFEPAFDEDTSANYVHHDLELLRLDDSLITSTSRSCMVLLNRIARDHRPDQIADLSKTYATRFAMDFAYEEWSIAFRDSLHSGYVDAVEREVSRDAASGHFDRALPLVRGALSIDPDDIELERTLIRLLLRSGSRRAAAEQYGHYATAFRAEFGIDAPPITALECE